MWPTEDTPKASVAAFCGEVGVLSEDLAYEDGEGGKREEDCFLDLFGGAKEDECGGDDEPCPADEHAEAGACGGMGEGLGDAADDPEHPGEGGENEDGEAKGEDFCNGNE